MVSETSGQLRRVPGVGFGLAVSIGGTDGCGYSSHTGLGRGTTASDFGDSFIVGRGRCLPLLGASCLTEWASCSRELAGFMFMCGALLATQRDLPSAG